MRIAYILDTYPSISETFIAREIEALRRRGFTIDVWALRAGDGASLIPRPLWLRLRGQWELRTEPARPEYYTSVGRAMWETAATRRALDGVEHIHAGWASHPAFIAWGLAQQSGWPWSFSGHARDLFVEGAALDAKMASACFATACTRAGHAVLTGATTQPHQAIYAPHGLEIARYDFARRAPNGRLELLAVGRLIEKKGYDVLLAALALLQEQGVDCTATIIGDGPLAQALQAEAQRLEVDSRVAWTGALDHEAVIAAMHAASCLVLPSKTAADGDRDGLPNVLLEAAAVGLPIVATTAGSVTDFLNESNSRLCPPADAAALAAAVGDVGADAGRTADLAAAARAAVERDFDADRNIEIMTNAFLAACPPG